MNVTNTVDDMRANHDFSKGRRGPVLTPEPGKTRITIRIDTDVLDWFRDQVTAAGGGNYAPCPSEVI
jgi:uncharacterized protein (DUF4415 family)